MAVMIRVIICTHNGVRFLEAQLASIMNQNRSIDVVHLFDFASSDGTRELLGELTSRWPKLDVRMVSCAPGVTLSFFHAFAQIAPQCGADDTIFLSDQDDIWLPNKTERMLDCLNRGRREGEDRLLVFHDVQICDAALQPLRQSFYEGRPFALPQDLATDRLLITNPVIGHTVAITKPLLDIALSCLRPRYYAMHDWALVLVAAHAGKIVYISEQLGLYRQHEMNILGAARKRSMGDYIKRGIRLSRTIGIQTSAFVEDFCCIARAARITNPTPILPGRGPLAWRLGLVMARRGHTIGHRLMAIVQLKRVLWRGKTLKNSENRSKGR